MIPFYYDISSATFLGTPLWLKSNISIKVLLLVWPMKRVVINRACHGWGWCQIFSDRGMTLPTRGLKHGCQGTINGLACSDRGYSPL